MKIMETRPENDFEYTPPSVGTIKTAGRVYTDSPIRGNFNQLRQADYGKGFRQPTFGELLDLTISSYLNQGNNGADKVVQTAKQFFLSGNTAILYTPQLVIVQDMPRVENGRIVMDKDNLVSKLGLREENGVRFSDDGTIRSINYGFETEWQTTDQMRNNPFSIALTGDILAPEKLAEIQEKIGMKAYVWALDKGTNNVIRVPGLSEIDGRLVLGGDDWYGLLGDRCSFGVQQIDAAA